MNISFPASVTLDKSIRKRLYKWKDKKHTSTYNSLCNHAVLRISSFKFTKELSKLESSNRMVVVDFFRKDGVLNIKLNRISENGKILQTYFCSHPYLQLIVNKELPKDVWIEFFKSNKKTCTFPVLVTLDLDEWADIDLQPYDFLIQVETLAKELMKTALKFGFNVHFVPKGRSHDLELIGPSGTNYVFAVSSHIAKNQSRSKEKIKQKILMDIAKMLPTIHSRNIVPVVLSQSFSFEGSWSFNSTNYFEFYKDKFNFKFLSTDFKENWADKICQELLELDKQTL